MPDIHHTHTCPDGTTLLFVWDGNKDELNQENHHVTLKEAAEAFCDPRRLSVQDRKHSTRKEKRFFLFGKVGNGRVLTVRFTRRDRYIRIIGAGFWHEGQARYDNPRRP